MTATDDPTRGPMATVGRMRPSEALQLHRERVRAITRAHRVTNPRVFGSTALQDDTDRSDLDLLVEATADTTLFDLAALALELEHELGCDVDVVTSDDLPAAFRARVLAEAVQV